MNILKLSRNVALTLGSSSARLAAHRPSRFSLLGKRAWRTS